MIRKYLLLIFTCFLLASCKIELSSIVKVSELLSNETKSVDGLISVEILSCNNYEDSRQPSSELLEAQQKIKSVIPSAEYIQCYSKSMESYAEFKISMNVKPNFELSSNEITILNDGKGSLGLHIPNHIANQIKKSSFGKNDVSIIFTIFNDTESSVKFNVVGAFVDNEPYPLFAEVLLDPQQKVNIKLSDVVKEYILKGNNFIILKPSNNG